MHPTARIVMKEEDGKEESWVLGRKNPFVDPRELFPSSEKDFYPSGSVSSEFGFDPKEGPLRRQLVEKSNFLLPLEGYRVLRPVMKKAFAAVSRDGTDNGWIATSDEFKQLMKSVGAHKDPAS